MHALMHGAPSSWPDRGTRVAYQGFAIERYTLATGLWPPGRRRSTVESSMTASASDLESKAMEAFVDDDFELAAELYDDHAKAHMKLDNYTGQGEAAARAMCCGFLWPFLRRWWHRGLCVVVVSTATCKSGYLQVHQVGNLVMAVPVAQALHHSRAYRRKHDGSRCWWITESTYWMEFVSSCAVAPQDASVDLTDGRWSLARIRHL